jgi:hypothetical protein
MKKLLFTFGLLLFLGPWKVSAQTPTLIYSTNAPLAIPSGSGWSAPGCSATCYHIPLDKTATTAGSTLVLFFGYDSLSSNQVFSVTDDKSNTWTLDIASAQSNNKTMRVYRATNIAAGTSYVNIQLTAGSQNNYWQPLVLEFFDANALDGSSCNTATSATVSAGSITPTVSGDLIVQAKYSTTRTSQTASFAAGSQSNITWSLASQLLGDGAAEQYGVYNSTAAIIPTFTQAASDTYISCAIALKAASTGSAATALPRIVSQMHDAMPKNSQNPWKAGTIVNTSGAVYISYVGNDAIHSTNGVLDGVTSVPAPNIGWTTGADFVGSNGHNHVNSFCAQFNSPPGPLVISINRVATTNDSINMIYVVPGGTCNVDVDSGGTTGDQTTGTSITIGTLTPTVTNDIGFGFGGQFWCTSTSLNSPASGQFDAVFFSGITIDGPAQTDENNFWFHFINADLSMITATVQDTCTGSSGPGSPTFWAARMVAYKSAATGALQPPTGLKAVVH